MHESHYDGFHSSCTILYALGFIWGLGVPTSTALKGCMHLRQSKSCSRLLEG